MRATVIHGPHDVRLEVVPEPQTIRPTDALIRVEASCVCGSDLWRYRGVSKVQDPVRIGHEFVGVVEEVGADVAAVSPGDFVIAPFTFSCGECVNCRNGVQTSCVRGGTWAQKDQDGLPVDGGQGERVRVPLADGTLVVVPGTPDPALLPALLSLSDVMGTGHHAALRGGVREGSVVAVVGDGAVGLCAVLAARRLGAARIVAFSRHAARQELARRFGADDVIATRGDEGVAELRELLDAPGADVVIEAVGTQGAMEQAVAAARPGGNIGYVGVPAGITALPVRQMFGGNINLLGGVAPVRAYVEELLPEVLDGTLDPGPVFDLTLPLDEVARAYEAMDQREAVKVMLRG